MLTLQEIKSLDGITGLEYSGILADGSEYVTALFRDRRSEIINVSGSSESGMVFEIIRVLGE